MATLTVFTPAYNRAHTLPRTYESLLAQDCKDFVWLIVDDGSSDNIREILEGYCAQYPNIKAIHKENGGLSDARNAGIEIASGSWLAFIDSDDWVTPDMFAKLLAKADETGLLPEESNTGIKIMSVNLLLESEDSPVVWRGPVISGVIQQFWKDVAWGDVDYMFVDMPPGTGDVSLTVFQNLPVDGIVIVTTPQDLVTMIVKKAFNMAKLMNIPVIGMVENMSYVVCPDCGKQFSVFGGGSESVAEDVGTELLAKMPIDVSLAQMVDNGSIERFSGDFLKSAAEKIENFGK